MPRTASPLPSSLQPAFTTGSAIALGVPPGRLRTLDLDAPFHGVRTRRETAPSLDDANPLAIDRAARAAVLRKARAYALVMSDHAFFIGRTAAVVHGLPVRHGEDLEIAVFAPARAARGRGVRGVSVSAPLATVGRIHGLQVATPTSTWASLGGALSVRDLVILGDAIVRIPRDERGLPRPNAQLATIESLRSAASVPYRRHRKTLDAALAHVRVGSMSPLETDYRLNAEHEGFPEPELDVEIRDASGRLLGISDIVYRRFATIVEVEGDHHRTSRTQWSRDLAKYAAYAAAGWDVVRLDSAAIRGRDRRGVATVRAALARHGWRG